MKFLQTCTVLIHLLFLISDTQCTCSGAGNTILCVKTRVNHFAAKREKKYTVALAQHKTLRKLKNDMIEIKGPNVYQCPYFPITFK